jgi:hypothetical protein
VFVRLKEIAVEPVQAVPGAEPHKAILVLHAAQDAVIRQAILYLVMPEIIRLSKDFPGIKAEYGNK